MQELCVLYTHIKRGMELVLSGLQLYFAKARVFTYEFWYFNEKIQGDNLSILAHYLAKKMVYFDTN